jgi:hypothetical protein
MFICTDQLDDSFKKVTVEADQSDEHPILLKFKLGGYATRIYMDRVDALDLMSQLEKAIHKTAEEVVV